MWGRRVVKKVKGSFDARRQKTDSRLYHGLRALIHKYRGIIVKISELSKSSGVSRSTFYRYYGSVNEFLVKTEEDILGEFRADILPIARSNATLQVLFLRLLVFVRERKDYFQIAFDLESHRLLVKMLQELRPIIADRWTNYGNSNQIYHVYSHEISAIIILWYKEDHFSKTSLDHYVEHMVYITRYANSHLKGLPRKSERSKSETRDS